MGALCNEMLTKGLICYELIQVGEHISLDILDFSDSLVKRKNKYLPDDSISHVSGDFPIFMTYS